jgi:hypothetical protein
VLPRKPKSPQKLRLENPDKEETHSHVIKGIENTFQLLLDEKQMIMLVRGTCVDAC